MPQPRTLNDAGVGWLPKPGGTPSGRRGSALGTTTPSGQGTPMGQRLPQTVALEDAVLAALRTLRTAATSREIAAAAGMVERTVEQPCYGRHLPPAGGEFVACQPAGRLATVRAGHPPYRMAWHTVRRPVMPYEVSTVLNRLARDGRVVKTSIARFRSVLWSLPSYAPPDGLEDLWQASEEGER